MLIVTKTLRAKLAERFTKDNETVKFAEATDDVVRKFAGEKIVSGELDGKDLADWSKPVDGEARVRGMVAEEIAKHLNPIAEQLTKLLGGNAGTPAGGNTDPGQTETDLPGNDATKALIAGAGGGSSGMGGSQPNVKPVVDQFDDSRTAATWAKSSKPFLRAAFGTKQLHTGHGGRALDMPTERKQAIAGAYFKHMIGRAHRSKGMTIPREFRLTELDERLVKYALHECKFVGPIGWDEKTQEARDWVVGKTLTDLQRKAVLDDSVSGGLEAVPIEFDDLAILTPLLNGELYPLVTVRNVTRRRIEGFSIANPTVGWSAAEGTEIPLFDTDGFIAAFDTTIYPCTGSIEMGLDFEADSPVNVGDIIVQRYGEVFRQELDNVIATGDGTTQPLGIFNTSGAGAIPASTATTGPLEVADFENLLFGVAKEYRSEAGRARAIFLSNETSYSRARAIPVDSSADQRRIFGMDEESYELLGHPYKINETITNPKIGFVCMNRYRMYRRAGFEVRVVTEDKELARRNQRLILVRARFGGQMEQSAAFASIDDAQS
jgi:HK97 family phage major capsid protein